MLNLVGVAGTACILNASCSSCMLFPFHILCNKTSVIWPRGVSVHATFKLKGSHYISSSHRFHLFQIKSQHCDSNPANSSSFSFTQSEANNNNGSTSGKDNNGINNKDEISSSTREENGDGGAKEPSSKDTENNSWKLPNWNWNWNRGSGGHGHIEIWGLLFQLTLLLLFMRLLRPGLMFYAARKPRTLLMDSSGLATARVSVSFSEFLQRIKRNHVQRVEIDGAHFTFSLRPEAEEKIEQELDVRNPLIDQEGDLLALAQLGHLMPVTTKIIYTTTKPSDITTPYEKMIEDGVEFGAPDKRSGRLISSLSVALLYIVLVVGLLVRLPFKFPQQQFTGHFHKRKRKGDNGTESTCLVTFADVAGIDEAKELEEIVEYLRTPDRFSRLGARPPRGVLLVGLPGTGKTLLAKAVAGEADVPFISCSASEFVELYVGMGASRVRDLFVKAKKDAPSIVFIDEIDAVAKGRDVHLRSVSNDEREQTLNQLLTELDGFESNSTVIVLAATNRADVLDPALRRPGRFDRVVMVDPPDRRGREEILRVHVVKKQVPLASDVDLAQVAAVTSGFTGADLANLVNEAALLAGRAGKLEVHEEEFTSAIERSIAGIEKKRSTLHEIEKSVVARHEAGHAVVGTAIANLLPGLVHIEKLSILPRSGGTLGFTYLSPGHEDRYLLFVDEIRGRLVTLLGGRAAEEVIYRGRVSTGAIDDIKRATDVAYKAVAEYGLNSCIGPVSLATLSGGGLDDSGAVFPWTKDQGHVTDLVQREVRALLQSALEMALLVIRSNPTVLEGLGAQLEAEEKVEGECLQIWLNNVVAPTELAAFIKGDAYLV